MTPLEEISMLYGTYFNAPVFNTQIGSKVENKSTELMRIHVKYFRTKNLFKIAESLAEAYSVKVVKVIPVQSGMFTRTAIVVVEGTYMAIHDFRDSLLRLL